ncbi:MAG: hypothetical protein RMM98_03370 [Acidobacteriota bacterium]|nr:hypothetical protein [Acidobacteriota bacterium]
MAMKLSEELINLLRNDPVFREEARRQILTDELLTLPERFERLTRVVEQLAAGQQRQSEQIERLIATQERHSEQLERLTAAQIRLEEAQARTEQALQAQIRRMDQLIVAQAHMDEALRELLDWQRGTDGRWKGEQYEREIVRSAPMLFNGGQGGTTDQPWVQQRLTDLLSPILADGVERLQENPFLADLIWWKGDQVAVVEVSLQVNGYDVERAAQRARVLRRVGLQVVPIVIGKEWANDESRDVAQQDHVEWKVGSDISSGFIAFRRIPHASGPT